MVGQRRCSPGTYSGRKAGPGRVTRATIVKQPPGGGTAISGHPRPSGGRRLSPRGLPSHRRGGREGAARDSRPGRSPASQGRCSSARRAKVPPKGCRSRGGPFGRRTGETPLPAACPGEGTPRGPVARRGRWGGATTRPGPPRRKRRDPKAGKAWLSPGFPHRGAPVTGGLRFLLLLQQQLLPHGEESPAGLKTGGLRGAGGCSLPRLRETRPGSPSASREEPKARQALPLSWASPSRLRLLFLGS